MEADSERIKKPHRRLAIFLYILTWLISWPLLMGVAALIIGGVGALVILSIKGEETITAGVESRLYFALFTIVMVIIASMIIRKMKNSEDTFIIADRKTLKVYTILGVLLGIVTTAIIPDQSTLESNAGINTQTADSFAVPPIQKDASIEAVLSSIGATDTTMIDTRYVQAYDGSLQNQQGEYQAYLNPTTGGFLYATLTIKQGLTANDLAVVTAHEYLHHVWFAKLDEPTKQRLTSDLIAMYGSNPYVRDRLKSYVDNSVLQPTELFSFYCTELSDMYLSQYVLAQGNTYINRSSLVLQL